jgi:photosystem II stability/assembly factor-like uncharacterized protein
MKSPLFLATVAILVIAPLAFSAESKTPTTAPAVAPPYAIGVDGEPPVARVGIPDVCAWPNLALMSDGTIAAFVFNQPSHGRLIGGIDCYASTDGGATWTKRATAAPPDPGVQHTRMNHAAGIAANGDLIVIAGGWTVYPKPNEHGPYEVDKLMRPVVCRSSDGGRTWSMERDGFPETEPGVAAYVPFGAIARAKDGSLRVSAYADKAIAYVLRSDDDGHTWTDPVRISTQLKPNETTLWSDGKGRMLAAGRTRTLEIFESSDDGASWRHLSRASDDLGIPGDLRQLADGRLLVTHGIRVNGIEGVDARVSADGGRTWSAPRRVADFITYDGGYPSSVQRADGMVVTAFYARRTKDRDGYQMGVVIWDPARTFPVTR